MALIRNIFVQSIFTYFWCCQLQADIFVAKFDIFKHNRAQNVDLKKLIEPKNGINS